MKKLPVILLLLFSDLSESYRILGLFPLPSRSHMIVFDGLMKKLVEKGHEVDVFSHFPQPEAIAGYNDISLQGTVPVYDYTVPIIRAKLSNRYTLGKYILRAMGVQLCKTILNSTVAKDLKNSNKKYDLVISEVFSNDCILGFGYHFKAPIVGIITSVSIPWGGDRIGNPDNPSYIPNYFLPYFSDMTFMERLINTFTLLVTKLGFAIARHKTSMAVRDFFNSDLPHLKDLARNTSLILVNSHFGIDYVHPTVPNLIEVGGLHMKPLKPLPKNFQNFLDDIGEYKGIIYLSMGSMVLTETLSVDKLKALFDTFRELPYKVLWKAVHENMPKNLDIPSNVHFEPWMPQLDILCHPNVKVFVTHGGLLGVQESVFCGVPVFGIPFFGDHEYSLKRAIAKGYGVMIDYDDMTTSSISKAIKTVLHNTTYKTNAEKVSRLFKDRPISAIDTAAYWIEYVIRHKGAPHLRSVGADLPWFQYYLVDVGMVLLMSFMATAVLIYCSVVNLSRIMFTKRLPKNNSKRR